MPITPIQIAVPLAIAAFMVIARLSKNPFLIIASYLGLGAYMFLMLGKLMQAFLGLGQVGT
jgi:hypothetical protein